MKLTLTNQGNESAVEQMVYNAMCAWANWQSTIETSSQLLSVSYKAKYEAITNCIEMLVEETLSEVRGVVVDRARAEFGI